MIYDFDRVVDRRGSSSLKWDTGEPDVLPMWVADMDFAVAEPIQKALKRKVEHAVFGYAEPPAEYYDSICRWHKKRHGWDIKSEWITYSPGIVSALHLFHKCFLNADEKVLMFDPVYYPFVSAAERNNVEIEKSRLLYKEKRYEIDFSDFESRAKDPSVKMFLLCNPHNPGGRCWTREELLRIAQICIENEVLIISDEIHCDLLLNGSKHVPCASLSEEIAKYVVTCVAPSKTFNLAGLQTSAVIISNPELKQRYDKCRISAGIMRPGTFGIEALISAYNDGEEWLDQLIPYLEGNLAFLISYMKEHLPLVDVMIPNATYLVWMNFEKYGIDPVELHNRFLKKGKVWLDEGYLFGETGNYFERINIACPRSVLKDALNRMYKTLCK